MYKNLTLFRNIRLVNCKEKRIDSADLLYGSKNGKSEILQIGKGIRIGQPDGLTEIAGKGKLAVPFFTDLRASIPDPGFSYRETLAGGLLSAMAGGFGRVLLNPCTKPLYDHAELLEEAAAKALSASDCHLLFSVPLTKGALGHELLSYDQLKRAGAKAVNADFEKSLSPHLIFEGAVKAAEADLLFIAPSGDPLFCKNAYINDGFAAKQLHTVGMDESSELYAAALAVTLAKTKKVPVHLPLVSLKSTVDLIRKAKSENLPITCGTSPSYFSFTESEVLFSGSLAKLMPPLRLEEDRLAVIEGLKDGTIDVICSDHAPYSQTEKEVSDFSKIEDAAFGAVGFETAFAAGVTHLLLPGHLKLFRLLELMSLNPAMLLKENDEMEIGNGANFALIDEKKEMVYTNNTLISRSSNTPFYGSSLYGRVEQLVIDGNRQFPAV